MQKWYLWTAVNKTLLLYIFRLVGLAMLDLVDPEERLVSVESLDLQVLMDVLDPVDLVESVDLLEHLVSLDNLVS